MIEAQVIISKTRYQRANKRGICARARPPAFAKAMAGRRSKPALSVRSPKGVGGSACATVFSTIHLRLYFYLSLVKKQVFAPERH